jgi:methylenetetrahydrofolate reductase (NADPH)
MKVTDHFAKSAGNTLVSFEVLPPLKGGSMQAIFRTLDALMEYKPPFIDVTYHREEYIYTRCDPRVTTRRPPSESDPAR